jgi:hypothetical protein
MSSISAANAMIVEQQIEEGIKREFLPEMQSDARRLLKLASRAGDRLIITLSLIYGIPLGVVSLFWTKDFMVGVYIILVAVLIATISQLFRKKAQREMDELIASNPSYWQPICKKLQRIILEVDKLDDDFRRRFALRA